MRLLFSLPVQRTGAEEPWLCSCCDPTDERGISEKAGDTWSCLGWGHRDTPWELWGFTWGLCNHSQQSTGCAPLMGTSSKRLVLIVISSLKRFFPQSESSGCRGEPGLSQGREESIPRVWGPFQNCGFLGRKKGVGEKLDAPVSAPIPWAL